MIKRTIIRSGRHRLKLKKKEEEEEEEEEEEGYILL